MITTVEIDIDNPTQLESVLAFIEKLGLKAKVFKNGENAISEINEEEYLYSSKANKQQLLHAIDYIENGGELIRVNLDELKKQLLPND